MTRASMERTLEVRLRAEVERLGGQRAAARKARVSPGAVAGWMRKRGRSLPDLLTLVALTSGGEHGDTSLDYLCGRDVPEFVGVSRRPAELADDLRAYVEAHLARLVPPEDVERYLADDVLGRAVELLRRDVVDAREREAAPRNRLNRHRRRILSTRRQG